MLNKIIMGRLTRDPELRRTGSGTEVASFTLAVDRDFKTQDGKKETDFIDIVAWRGTGEFVSKYFSKGRKTVTRRSMKPQPAGKPYPLPKESCYPGCWGCAGSDAVTRAPYQPGDILWVRETWCEYDEDHVIDGVKYAYKADATQVSEESRKQLGYRWRPSIHMPREAARLFLRVKVVCAERLQDITPKQIDSEGCKEWGYSIKTGELLPSSPSYFKIAWDSTIKLSDRPIYGWDANPWVWVIEFERISGSPATMEALHE